MQQVILALGSNLGDRTANLSAAIGELRAFVQHPRWSHAVETAPIDCAPDAPCFLNAVLIGETDLEPLDLLRRCQAIEAKMGRAAIRPRNADRVIDIDILCLGSHRCDSATLVLPHPTMHLRDFVLHPLAELLPDDPAGPDSRSVTDLLADAPIRSILKTGIPIPAAGTILPER